MRRTIEIPLVLVVSLITLSASATAIRDARQGKTDPVLREVQSVAHSVGKWFQATSKPAVKGNGGDNHQGLHSEPNDNVSGADHESLAARSGPAAPWSGWSQSDVSEVESILRKLATPVSPVSLEAVYQSLSENHMSVADAQITKLITSKLSLTDQHWLSQHFSGPEAFNEEDVRLLAESLSQLEHELTPQEKQMARDKLSAFFTSMSAKTVQ